MKCKICAHETYILHDEQFKIDYHRCSHCGFIYEDPLFHIDAQAEKEEYNRHNNSIEDEGYVNMFKRFQKAFEPYIEGKRLLEFGSGPEPVFSEVLRRDGYDVTSFDPYYLPDISYLDKVYDVITSTEVFEHLSDPMGVLAELKGLLAPGGVMAIMTQFAKSDEHFKTWWYRRDPTHIAFYTPKAFEIMSKKMDLSIVFENTKDYMILKNNATE